MIPKQLEVAKKQIQVGGRIHNKTVYSYRKENDKNEFFRKPAGSSKKESPFSGRAGRTAWSKQTGCFKMGTWSFPKLKIPHQSHADFCSTDTAGGLDNKKRRYAPRGGVAYRLFLWGFPKGATPPFGTRLCEAKCSVLYALPALP